MRRCRVLLVAVSVAAAWGAAPLAASGAAAGGAARAAGVAVSAASLWGRAIAVPGLGALNKGRDAEVSSASCASPGNCGAGGYYTPSGPGFSSEGFVTQ